ncbi:hypothetical protein DSUL_170013 [Desulfovibrionales bacterium]
MQPMQTKELNPILTLTTFGLVVVPNLRPLHTVPELVNLNLSLEFFLPIYHPVLYNHKGCQN